MVTNPLPETATPDTPELSEYASADGKLPRKARANGAFVRSIVAELEIPSPTKYRLTELRVAFP
jgi:hypothetical protein